MQRPYKQAHCKTPTVKHPTHIDTFCLTIPINMSTEPKYIMANLSIPIRIETNGQIEPLKDYLNIEFSPCPELPEKSTTQIDHSFFADHLTVAIQQLNHLDKPVNISIDVPHSSYDHLSNKKHKKQEQNTTFKRHNRSTIRYTQKKKET